MKYLLIIFENEKMWIEVDEILIAIRQVVKNNNTKVDISCRNDCLAEGVIDIDDIDGICKEISKEEFENIWIQEINQYYESWVETKKKYHKNKEIEGICRYFYPQGAIIEGEEFFAVYKGDKDISMNEIIKMKIVEYDDTNLWLITK